MFLFRSLLRSFSGGSAEKSMHILCVAHVQCAHAKRVTRVQRTNVFAHLI